jgi:uncharacterized protein (UPF0332 family)
LPSKEEHLETALHNEKLADTLAATAFPDWAVTVYFYSALHYAHAVLAVYGQHPQSHDTTAPLVRTNLVLKRVWTEYRSLQTASRNARYYCTKITPEHLQQVLMDFNSLKSYVCGQLGVK